MLPSLATLALQTDAGQGRKRTLDEAMPDGFSMLCRAAQDGNLKRVRDLLNNGARVDNAPHKTPLMIASKHGYTKIVKLLLKHGARVDRTSYDGNTPLVIASEEGHTEIVNLLLEGGAKVDTASRLGQTPLMIACEEGHFEIVKLLIEHGANVDKVRRRFVSNEYKSVFADARRARAHYLLKKLAHALVAAVRVAPRFLRNLRGLVALKYLPPLNGNNGGKGFYDAMQDYEAAEKEYRKYKKQRRAGDTSMSFSDFLRARMRGSVQNRQM